MMRAIVLSVLAAMLVPAMAQAKGHKGFTPGTYAGTHYVALHYTSKGGYVRGHAAHNPGTMPKLGKCRKKHH